MILRAKSIDRAWLDRNGFWPRGEYEGAVRESVSWGGIHWPESSIFDSCLRTRDQFPKAITVYKKPNLTRLVWAPLFLTFLLYLQEIKG